MENPRATAPPTRFREAEERGRRIGRPLLRMSRISPELDSALMDRVGRGLLERDESGATLAAAMRLAPGNPDRVTHAQFAEALRTAPEVPTNAPRALRAFLAEVIDTPSWVDWESIERGATAFRYLGTNAVDVLLQLSLIGGYRFGGPPDLLARTGGLSGNGSLRRIAETEKWAVEATRSFGLRPGNEGWRLSVHVRAMHALVNSSFESKWDTGHFGLPINGSDQAATLGLFSATVLLGCVALGVRLDRAQRDDIMHLWRYVGWLMGVDNDFLTDDETTQHRINYHMLVAAGAQTVAGREVARATLDAQAKRSFGHTNPRIERLRQRYERERTLSMLTAFLGADSMRELGLPARVPWATLVRLTTNTWRYHLLGRVPGRRRKLESSGARAQQKVLSSVFHGLPQAVGDLPVADVVDRANA